MKFYELPPAVNNSIQNTDIRPYVRVLFELKDEDLFIPNSDILECVITSYKSVDDCKQIKSASNSNHFWIQSGSYAINRLQLCK